MICKPRGTVVSLSVRTIPAPTLPTHMQIMVFTTLITRTPRLRGRRPRTATIMTHMERFRMPWPTLTTVMLPQFPHTM